VTPPAEVPPAPWRSRVEAVLWWHRATPAARAALPAALAGRAGPPVTIGGMVAYREGPVGPYAEVFGAPLLLRGGPGLSHVAFMAVDSVPSRIGGRRNWALPKEIARFEGAVGAPGRATALGEGWALDVRTTVRARALPAWMRLAAAQVWPDGSVRAFTVTMRGRARLARASVRSAEPSALSEWLVAGPHPAVVVSGVQVVSAPRPA
jgi:hypothetical protein